jgi:hypothetical protein
MFAVASPNCARVHGLSPRLGARPCVCEQARQGKTGETSPQRSAKIDWGYAGVGSALARRYGFPSYSVSTARLESALVRETDREGVKMDAGVAVDDSVSEAGKAIYVRSHNSLPLPLRLHGYGPIRLVRMVVNVHASEPLYLA